MVKGIIRTIPEKCVQCYACVRNCPVKAVAIRDGKARIIQERCIHCGNCVQICSQNAKEVLDGIDNTLKLLEKGNAIAIVAPSFPAAFNGRVKELPCALRRLGFVQVWEVAVGAELVVEACRSFELGEHPYISTSCPAVVNLIERHYSQFVPYLMPVVSPAIATARLIRYCYPDEDYNVVFIGPCIAKKGEIHQSFVSGDVQEALTYTELEELFELKGVDWDHLKEEPFDGPRASLAYSFPISGGLLRNLNRTQDILKEDYVVIDGMKNWLDILEILEHEKNSVRLIDGLFCNGCIDGHGMKGRGNIIERKSSLLQYIRSIPLKEQAEGKAWLLDVNIDLGREFEELKVTLPQPEEEDILGILRRTGKESPEDQMNCGACGYPTCREKAIAVYQGIAEVEMCLPYLLSQKSQLVESLDKELKMIRELKKELDILIDASYDGICMTDSQGNIQRVNRTFEQFVGIDEEKLVGMNMSFLEKENILFPSVTMAVIRAKKAITFVQSLRSGKKILATGNPVMDEDGNVVRIIANLRDFDLMQKIREELDNVYHPSTIEKLDKDNPIIALSREFNKVLEMAARVAVADSNVLILGESGVGKEVIARFIHKNSSRSNGPFVKINCSALPESLIESELFGYETGAFTGASPKGKPGLFEVAQGGTLLLDEIGELPLSQQAKLLQVIQEKQAFRIGGTKPRKIDVRILAATNRDLAAMVKEGNFRADLFYRLNVIPIRIPPLRERRDDIIPLMYFFLERYNKRYNKECRMSKEAKEVFMQYYWPGNVRELENMVERLVVIAQKNIIDVDDLPPVMKKPQEPEEILVLREILPLKQVLEEAERQLLMKARSVYNSTYKMAEALGVNQSTVVRKLKKYFD